ncbi:MAG: hypothetical protein Q9M28_02545 [Mariprofundaceae bacterium]|nr:hypothetical protein [Mariprofundaceae bacterium]
MFQLILTYCVTLIKEVVHLAMMFATAILLSMGLIYAYSGAWLLYTHTQIGEKFIESQFELAEQIQILLTQGTSWMFSVEVALISLIASLMLAVTFQLLCVRHLLYTNLPLILKLVLCIALSFGVARYQMEAYLLTNDYIATILFAPLMLVLLPACMSCIPKLIPNLVQVALYLFEMMKEFLSKYR